MQRFARGIASYCPMPPGRVSYVRCPSCSSPDDKVVDSRAADDGSSIRRRRECLGCGRRFTTYERIEESPVFVLKRNGLRVPFERAKVLAGLRAATKNLAIAPEALEAIAQEVEENVRIEGPEVTSADVGLMVLDRLRAVDAVAYVRFASVYRTFTDPAEFTREVQQLRKSSAPKPTS
jgi:transcriptional repressor NrdR